MAEIWLRARRTGHIVSVCPSVYYRLGRIWRDRLYPDYRGWNGQEVRADLMRMYQQGHELRDIQQMLFLRWSAKLRMRTLIRWIGQEKHRPRATDIHYWSVQW